MRRLNIAVDFDDTITADTSTFRSIITTFQNAGHNVFIVTYRRETSDNTDIKQFCKRLRHPIQVVYTAMEAKEGYMRDVGVDVDIWIDDTPAFIVHDLEQAKEHIGKLYNKHALLDEPKQRPIMKQYARPIQRKPVARAPQRPSRR